MTMLEWMLTKLHEDLSKGLRIGQSYMNRVRLTETNPEIFYSTNEDETWEMIHTLEESR